MKDRVTILKSQNPVPANSRNSTIAGVVIICAAIAAVVAYAVINQILSGHSWLPILNGVMIMCAPVAAFIALLVAVPHFAANRVKPSRDRITYSDPVAKKIPWSAMRPEVGGESRNCAISRASNSNRMYFYPILLSRYLTFLMASLLVLLVLWLQFRGHTMYAENSPPVPIYIKFLGYAFVFMLLKVLSKSFLNPVRALTFEKGTDLLRIENKRIFGISYGDMQEKSLSSIYALQIITYTDREIRMQYGEQLKAKGCSTWTTTSNNRSVPEYEINVVFKNGERLNIINHKGKRAIYSDVKKLSEFLRVPIWDRSADEAAAYKAK